MLEYFPSTTLTKILIIKPNKLWPLKKLWEITNQNKIMNSKPNKNLFTKDIKDIWDIKL